MKDSASPWYLRRYVPISAAVALAIVTSFVQQAVAVAFGLSWNAAELWKDAVGYLFISVVLVGVVELMERRRATHNALARLANGLSLSLSTYGAAIGSSAGADSPASVEGNADSATELSSIVDGFRAHEKSLRDGYSKARETQPPYAAVLQLCVIALAATGASLAGSRRAQRRLVADSVEELHRSGQAIGDRYTQRQRQILQLAAKADVAFDKTDAAIVDSLRSRRVAHKAEAATTKSILDSIDDTLFLDPARAFAAAARLLQEAVLDQKDSISEFDVAEAFWTFGAPLTALADEAGALAAWAEALEMLSSDVDASMGK